ncbi:regulatory protein, FmdB family [Beutenbergia cavernae DSM 12333]|uniref:Regulatory protein, FmdB family n=1 Tax=Beutenbergia cavernae (strain ATCC BAA-8 / DSM 12333 / CCUG 43141 / JCM 11478 / NBRC 16432 / NCIMB 13614 / HKI 0122) TaxID=471853 RepID=C5BZJ1_BEUC1|nr:FmdB family zinc ribbon protein [Beutenbergia cavernae]ACQ79163.1 regulatory protein, FmdB family [Beutenbergia cavernae DSM 12333]
MPTYAYRCTACQHAFDVHQSFSDDALTECPECGGSLRKVFSAVGVVFKGSGFYRNDARGGTAGAATASGGGTESASTPSTSSGSDSTSSSSTSSGTSSTTTATKPAAAAAS